MSEYFSITDKTKGSLDVSGLPFDQVRKEVLGEKYTISLVFIDLKESEALNQKYRGKEGAANVLAFALDSEEGEIYITPKKAGKENELFGYSKEGFLLYLFIHASLHLKGFSHSSTMEEREREIARKFKVK